MIDARTEYLSANAQELVKMARKHPEDTLIVESAKKAVQELTNWNNKLNPQMEPATPAEEPVELRLRSNEPSAPPQEVCGVRMIDTDVVCGRTKGHSEDEEHSGLLHGRAFEWW